MMMTQIRFLRFIATILLTSNVLFSVNYAQENPSNNLEVYLNAQDKIEVRHTILPKQTLYSLSKYYQASIPVIKEANPGTDWNSLKIGQDIRIPIDKNKLCYQESACASARVKLIYRCRPKDNLFRISRIFFNTSINDLVKLNHKTSQTLALGERLHIGWLMAGEVPLVQNVMENPVVAEEAPLPDSIFFVQPRNNPEFKEPGQYSKVMQQNEVGFWNPKATAGGYFVMHKYAEIGTVIEIYNQVINKTVTAKVIGRLPENLYADEISLTISRDLAHDLGILDRKFFVRTKYIKNNVETAARK